MRSERERALDAFLASSMQLGDQPAMRQLAERWYPRWHLHVLRLGGDRDLADEVVQEAWIEIARGLPRLRDTQAFASWAYRIVSRRFYRSLRANRIARHQDEQAVDELAGDWLTPEANGEAQLVRRAMAKLSRDHRATLALFYFEDMRVAEVAVAMAVPVGTVKTRLMHARQALRQLLDGENHEQN